MRDIFKDTKWWMYIPFSIIFNVRNISVWVMTAESYHDKANRLFFVLAAILAYVMLIGMFIGVSSRGN